MEKTEVIQRLVDDKDYYGDFGKQYLSNSDIKTLLNNPLELKTPSKQIPAFLVGGYFHTAILEPDKLKNFKVVEASSRNTKAYKEITQGEMCLLQHEVDQCENLIEKVMDNKVCRDLIHGDDVEYERPNITDLFGNKWKGKADIVNHSEKLVIDLKTTAELDKFHWSAKKYNYDSQAYIYRELFGYEFIFIAVDKKTAQIGIFDCSDDFYRRGQDKVQRAVEAYELFFDSEDFDPNQFFITKTL